MFRTILILSYLIPNLYLFLRIWKLFIPRGYKVIYTVIYVLLFAIYPISLITGRENDARFYGLIDEAANYLLPFYLYLFIAVVLVDLLLFANLVLKLAGRNIQIVKSLRTRVFTLIILASILVVIFGIINFNTIRITEYRADIKGGSSDLEGLRIAFVSDFHLQEDTPVRFVERFVSKVNEADPDLMLFGGDIVEVGDLGENMEQISRLISNIETRYGAYGVLGNHEHYGRHEKGEFFEKAGIELIRDTVLKIGSSFILGGRNDSHERSRKSPSELLMSVDDSLPVILLDHRPTEIDLVSLTPADIQLSGHTHHGQLFPINLITGRIYKISYGFRKIGNTHFIVSSGIRLWGPPVRTVGKSEIVVVDLTFI